MPAALRLESAACGLCGSRRERVLFERPYALGSLSEGGCAATTDEFQGYGRIVRCLDCGLAYTSPRPGNAALLESYGACEDETYLAESSSRAINAHLGLNTIKRFVRSGRLLDVGASVGYFLNAARSDFEVLGLEPSAWARRVAWERFGLKLRPEPLEGDPRLPPASFDVVAMVDVLEHLGDPRRAASEATRALKPGGLLYLVTPDIGSLSARLLRGYWWGLRPAHVQYFDARTIGRLLEETGLEIVLRKSFGRIFSYGYWTSRLRHYPAPVHGALRLAVRSLGWEDKLLYLDTRDSMEICARRRP